MSMGKRPKTTTQESGKLGSGGLWILDTWTIAKVEPTAASQTYEQWCWGLPCHAVRSAPSASKPETRGTIIDLEVLPSLELEKSSG